MLKKLLLSVYWRQVDTYDFSVIDYKVKSCKGIFEERRQGSFLAMEMGSKFGMSFILGFTADLLEQELLTAHITCLYLCLSYV